ncbi:Satratoxin biosynthesis SC1 cluster protein 4 [Colletotrichum sp. SAR 10_70]|nr:Satratoxin biosynthesis SC1 cluster protein 4 [Colletotrichum sp. SAR 10_71]KAI8183008.1 Satratoxin biosynthesis SC1 cluster protein 4 [Colletotrichum sp. SAR 10_75]KAI8198770.1 Satratoxin biosynthesis SC1 cluster protein 4 [Colletotrichum sp. SAR 10_70]KAI8204461.1 Satratoxin biosynthesis SC1 cluster protein 4 [Colletotrichum sp. SAR 10_65]KAI8213755.1 Satratoxin biosynthesis SC1 cluster protein 4 [Colletotrichum sp. SAR 10_76]KAI8228577.1 Satratoxin biosynthesis SC1 cluster protein 4 [Col
MGWVLNATPEVEAISQWPTIIAICTVLSVLSVLIVGSRLYIRHTARGLASDDWMSLLSVVFALAYSGLTIGQTRYGLGLPIKLRPKANLIQYTRINFAGRPIYQIGISFFKIALLISYLRLLKGTDQKMVTIVSDVVVALLPIPVLLKLNIRLEKKVGLIAIFLLGLFTTLCSILRYLEINRIQFGDGNSTMLVLWGTIEFNNIVSSLPFLAPVCMKKAKDYRSKYSGGSSHGRSGMKHAERYKLSDMNHDKSVFASANHSKGDNGSEENILPGNIMKSVTYSVQVDDRVQGKGSTRRRDSKDSV